jgi:hypothetical protein
MALLRRSKLDRARVPSLLLFLAALTLTTGCETGYLIEAFPVCDPFVSTEEPPVAAASATFALAHAGPNPFAETTQLHYALRRPGRFTVEVFDASGRRVEVLAEGDAPAGVLAVPWTVTRATTRPAAGIYFVRAAFGGDSITEKVTLIR